MNVKQTVTITLPADPAAPAVAVFDGPLGDEALRLSKTPGSGWALVADDPASPGPYYLVDRRLMTPKPLRRGRPDASARMRAYNASKAKPAPAPKTPSQKAGQPAGETLEQWQERKARERFSKPAAGPGAGGFDF